MVRALRSPLLSSVSALVLLFQGGILSEAGTQTIQFEFPKNKPVGWLYKNWNTNRFLMTTQSSQFLADACGRVDLTVDPAQLSLNCNNNALKDASWVSKLPRNSINSLSLADTKVQDDWIGNLSRLDWLHEINLSRTRITDASLEKLAALKSLKVLNLSQTQITGNGLSHFNKLKHLQELSLENCPIEARYLSSLAVCSSLRNLQLAETGLDEGNYQYLLKLKTLENLDLRLTRVADKAVAAIAGSFPELESISLNSTLATARGFNAICKSKKLKVLSLGDCDLSKIGKIVLPKTLKKLNLKHAIGIDDKFVKETDLSSLDYLHLGSTRVSYKSLAKISSLHNLASLYLEGIDLSQADTRLLGQLEKMEILYLRGSKIKNSQLSFLPQLRSLRELDLSHSPVSDEAIKTLASCSSLKFISLSHTNFTKKGVLDLRKKLSGCRVEHELF